jgi:hypothetical protein
MNGPWRPPWKSLKRHNETIMDVGHGGWETGVVALGSLKLLTHSITNQPGFCQVRDQAHTNGSKYYSKLETLFEKIDDISPLLLYKPSHKSELSECTLQNRGFGAKAEREPRGLSILARSPAVPPVDDTEPVSSLQFAPRPGGRAEPS